LEDFRELLVGVKQHQKKTELASELLAERFSRTRRKSTVIMTGYQQIISIFSACIPKTVYKEWLIIFYLFRDERFFY